MQEVDYSLPTGTQIAEFRIIEILGVGGFGITYKAQDTRLDRLVAIKEFLPVELAARGNDSKTVMPRTNVSDDYQYGLTKFLSEAKTLAKFNHPNIVKVLTFIEENGTAYLVMEYVEGEALDEHLKKIHFNGNMAESRIREIIEPLLKGLAQVHKAGLLHRDIKPGNIYLQNSSDTGDDEHGNNPMLIDFGAARQSVGEKSKSISAIISQGYAPPEQYTSRGKQGPYTDIYAIGAVMYYLVTGIKPVESTDRQHDIIDEQPDPLTPIENDRGYSEALIAAITKAMMLRASSRPQHVAEFQNLFAGNKQASSETEKLSGDNDATRKIVNNVIPEVVKEKNEVNPKSKKPLLVFIIFTIIAVGGYFAFDQYQIQQAAELAEQKAKQQALILKQQQEKEFADKQAAEQKRLQAIKDEAVKATLAKKQQQERQDKLDQQAKRTAQIKKAQQQLNVLDFQAPNHGELDKRTQKAIEEFEANQGMTVTGVVDDLLLTGLSQAIKSRRLAEEKASADKLAKEKADKAAKETADKIMAEKVATDKKEKELADKLAAEQAQQSVPNIPAQEMYDKAINLILKEKKYTQAIDAFNDLLTAYPNKSMQYAANAHYWLGQLYFNKASLDLAQENFLAVINEFPTSVKVADSLLKLGMIFEKINKPNEAYSSYQKVINEHAESSAARLAKPRIEKLEEQNPNIKETVNIPDAFKFFIGDKANQNTPENQIIGKSIHKGLVGALLQDTNIGVNVISIAPDSAAAAAGLIIGDVIKGINRASIKNIKELKSEIKFQMGAFFALRVARGNSTMYIMIR